MEINEEARQGGERATTVTLTAVAAVQRRPGGRGSNSRRFLRVRVQAPSTLRARAMRAAIVSSEAQRQAAAWQMASVQDTFLSSPGVLGLGDDKS